MALMCSCCDPCPVQNPWIRVRCSGYRLNVTARANRNNFHTFPRPSVHPLPCPHRRQARGDSVLRSGGRTVSPIHAVFDLDLDFRSEQSASGVATHCHNVGSNKWHHFFYLQSFIRLKDTVVERTRSVRVENNSFLVGPSVGSILEWAVARNWVCVAHYVLRQATFWHSR